MGVVQNGVWARDADARLLKGEAAETSSTTHDSVGTGDAATAQVTVDVTAASGTSPTLVVVVEGTNDGSTWVELGRIGANGYRAGTSGTAPSNLTGVAQASGVFPATRAIRSRSIIGGTTPSFTYSVSAELV